MKTMIVMVTITTGLNRSKQEATADIHSNTKNEKIKATVLLLIIRVIMTQIMIILIMEVLVNGKSIK